MKPTFFTLAIALFFCAVSSHAQSFAPPGSEWYHSMQMGTFHSYYDGDTVINGTPCRKIARKALTKEPYYSMGARAYHHYTMCVYDNVDTVFLYNIFFKKFTPLYVFNVVAGDTVKLPVIPMDIAMLTFVTTDSTFSFLVDSVKMVQYDTANLRTVYSHSLGSATANYVYRYGGGVDDSGSVYTERIGGGLGFLPFGRPYAMLLDELIQAEDSLKCYNDPTMSIKMVSGVCGIPPVSVHDNNIGNVNVYPNPADEQVTIAGLSAGSEVMLTDVMGRVVAAYTASCETLSLPTATLHPGMYVLSFVPANGSVVHRQMTIVH